MSITTKDELMKEYDLSSRGFLPENPVEILSNIGGGAYDEWENFMNHLPEYNNAKSTRRMISTLPEINVGDIKECELKRLYVILSLIANSYVFCDVPTNILPSKIAKPFWHVSWHLGITPSLTHASVDLFNWKLKDETKALSLDNLQSINLMTGKQDEEWFYLTMIAIENIGGRVISDVLDIVHGWNVPKNGDKLENILTNLEEMCKVIQRMYEKCDSTFFYNQLRPFLSGSKGNSDLPNGLIFESVNGDVYQQFYGGSAAQSSLFQVLDAVFGIEHADNYFKEIRGYMPGKHRKFIEYISSFSLSQVLGEEYSELYKKCVSVLKKFRKLHFALVQNYIVKHSKNTNDKGTGGTELNSFLKQSIKETKFD